MGPGYNPAPVSNVNLPMDIQAILNRICASVNTQRKRIEEFYRQIIPETINGVTAYRQQDFVVQSEREFHLSNGEAAQIANFFQV